MLGLGCELGTRGGVRPESRPSRVPWRPCPQFAAVFKEINWLSCNFDAWVLQASAAERCAALGALAGLGDETMPCSQLAALFQ